MMHDCNVKILFQVCSKIIHVLRGDCVEQEVALVLLEHFKHFGSPVMIGTQYSFLSRIVLRDLYNFYNMARA